MDEFKYLKPQFSYSVKDLANYYGVCEDSFDKAARLNETNNKIQVSTSGLSDTDQNFNETFSKTIRKSLDPHQKAQIVLRPTYKKPQEATISKDRSLGRKLNNYPLLPKLKEKPNPRYIYKFEVQHLEKPTHNTPSFRRQINRTSIQSDMDKLLARNKKELKTEMGNYSDLEVIKEDLSKKSEERKRLTPVLKSRNWKEPKSQLLTYIRQPNQAKQQDMENG
eukprot:TRINITY_DN4020_c0_g1_i4.p1 TRINITY_DN4020_c0_g1~~TRINITY_DN4020_c0_g1_i4.p1  ORF type:complete len:222 (-),score=40.10 TRINITY_DN4020_c0_g1_i4:754-1419(-)